MMNFRWFGNGIVTLPKLIIADVFPLWHCVKTTLKALDQQTNKTSVFIELVMLADDQLMHNDI